MPGATSSTVTPERFAVELQHILLMFPIGSCLQPSALASFCISPECSSCRSSLMFAGKLGGVRFSSLVHQVEDPSGMPEHTLRKLSEEVLDCPSSSPGRGFCSPE